MKAIHCDPSNPTPAGAARSLRHLVIGWASLGLIMAQEPRGQAGPAAPPPPLVTLEGVYTGEVFTISSGGLARGAVYRGLLEAALEVNLGTIGAPSGLKLHTSALSPHGGAFSSAKLGDLQGASNIEAYNHPVLFEMWAGGSVGGDLAEVRVGRLAADADFATTEGGSVFLNSSFGWPAFISANTLNTGPAFYRTSVGGFTRLKVNENLQAQAGVYDGDSFDSPSGDPTRHPGGLHFEFGHGQGVFAIGEVTLLHATGPDSRELPSTLKLGVWVHTAEFADQFDSTRTHSGNHGWYAVAETTLWSEPARTQGAASRRLLAFACAGLSPRDRSPFDRTADVGLSFAGLLPGRPSDVLGFGAAWVHLSEDARKAERMAGATVLSDYEFVIEATYQLSLGERWKIAPDLQWVRHPGGSSALGDALVLGLRTRLEF